MAAARLRNPTLAGGTDSTTVGAARQTTPVHITVDIYPRVELTLAWRCKHEASRCLHPLTTPRFDCLSETIYILMQITVTFHKGLVLTGILTYGKELWVCGAGVYVEDQQPLHVNI